MSSVLVSLLVPFFVRIFQLFIVLHYRSPPNSMVRGLVRVRWNIFELGSWNVEAPRRFSWVCPLYDDELIVMIYFIPGCGRKGAIKKTKVLV